MRRLDEIELRADKVTGTKTPCTCGDFYVAVTATHANDCPIVLAAVEMERSAIHDTPWLLTRLRQAEEALLAVEKWHAPDCPSADRRRPSLRTKICRCPHAKVVKALALIQEET